MISRISRFSLTPNQATETPTVFIVDSDPAVRESLDVTIRSAGWRSHAMASAEEFLAHPRLLTPCCVLIEQQLPGSGGLRLQRLINDRIEMPVIFMSADADIPAAVEAMKAGAIEFLTKPLACNALLRAIDEAIARSRTELQFIPRVLALQERYYSLSARERQVMALVAAGRLNKQVGAELGISEITVKAHRGRMMRKMHAKSLAELVSMAANLPCDSESTSVGADYRGELVGGTATPRPRSVERCSSRTFQAWREDSRVNLP